MYTAHDQIEIKASPEQVFEVLANLARLPEWYVPSEGIDILTTGPVALDWQFNLQVRTLGGVLLNALGTVKLFNLEQHAITWHGKTWGIEGDSCWQAYPQQNHTLLKHTFQGSGWMLFLSKTLGRNRMTVRKRLTNLKKLVEAEVHN